jgi:fido (protein-threonine AMPylation protein)
MLIAEILKLVQAISGHTQAELAHKLGVTFVALNRWMNNRATPHPRMIAKIEALRDKVLGISPKSQSIDTVKKEYLLHKKKSHQDPICFILKHPDVYDQFLLSLTYNTNSIEGSTFSEADTSEVLFQNATVSRKSLREHLEVSNHKAALEYLFDHLECGRELDETFVLMLHGKLMNGIREDAGQYRTHAVRIVGTHVPTANPQSIAKRMNELIKKIRAPDCDIFETLAHTHAEFEQIHPFSDGNGRIGRLLMHTIALRAGMPPVVVKTTRRRMYMKSLNQAQMKGEHEPLVEFVCDSLIEGYKILDRHTQA